MDKFLADENLSEKRIAYCGIEGAFANIAAKKIFPQGKMEAFSTFAKAYNAVVQSECDFAVLPLENSFAGEVSQVSDLMLTGSLFINSVHELHVSQTLLSLSCAELSDIKKVVSHQQALDQCNEFIIQNGFSVEAVSNTAVAAKFVSEKNDKSLAAIASEETANLYGLKVLKKNINQNEFNTTRFAVFSREQDFKIDEKKQYLSILMFAIKNKPGSLAKTIKKMKGFNLVSLHSRPIKNVPWEYIFYVEIEGSLYNAKGKKLIKKLQKECTQVKILGHFYKTN